MVGSDDAEKSRDLQRLDKLEEHVLGSHDSRIRETRPGIMTRIDDMENRIDENRTEIKDLKYQNQEAESVAKTRKNIIVIGTSLLIAQAAVITLLMRLAGVF